PPDVQLGMTARVGLGKERADAAIVVPLAAVVDRGQGAAVWIVKDNKAQRRPVEVVQFHERGAVLGKGISAGELVVVSGAHLLVPDQAVQAKPLSTETRP
ncbi:MAG TPA: hypothetical protein PLW86_10380, partial [Rhodocyclaceae bacterium]|nr:hypothetical protein [Rhodocyclaceae bacterium]